MSTNHPGPDREDKREPTLAFMVVKPEPSPTTTDPASLLRGPSLSFHKRPPFNHPRPPLADNYDDDLPPAA